MFGYYIRHLNAWASVIQPLTVQERIEAIVDLVEPVACLCIQYPYALKGQLTDAAALLSWHVLYLLGHSVRYTPKSSPRRLNELAARWSGWTTLGSTLDALDDEAYRRETQSFRNQFHHGLPPNIEVGIQPRIIIDTSTDRYRFGFLDQNPISIHSLVPRLLEQHHRSIAAFRAFQSLLQQQIDEIKKMP